MISGASAMRLFGVVAVLVTPSFAGSADNLSPGLYEASPAQPFGRRNPAAPKELAQFDFLIGAFDCDEEITDLKGNSTQLSARWSGKYVLNGFGIQDSYWNKDFSTTNVRIYDDARSEWQVTYFRMPKFESGAWTGSIQGPDIILRRSFEYEGEAVESRLTFQKITSTGFEWVSKYIKDDLQHTNWSSTCHRLQ